MNTSSDTFGLAKVLQRGDFSEVQTEALVEVVRSIEARDRADLVTKDYFEAKLYQALFVHGLLMVGAILGVAMVI